MNLFPRKITTATPRGSGCVVALGASGRCGQKTGSLKPITIPPATVRGVFYLRVSASGRTTTLGGRGSVSAFERMDAQNSFVRGG